MANNSYCMFCFPPPCAKLEIYLANITFFCTIHIFVVILLQICCVYMFYRCMGCVMLLNEPRSL